MIRSRSGLKVMGLSLVALGLMAFSASAAQASTWMVGGKTLTGTETKQVAASIVAPSVSLLTKISGTEFQFTCTGGQTLETRLEKEGKISEGSQIRFTGCKTFTRKSSGEAYKEQAACVPYNRPEQLEEEGVIETFELKGQLQLHEVLGGVTEGVTTIEAKTGGLTGHVATISTPECSIASEVKVFGKLAVVDLGGIVGLEEEKKVHKIKEFASLTHLYAETDTAEHKVTIDGQFEVKLAGELAWNGLRE